MNFYFSVNLFVLMICISENRQLWRINWVKIKRSVNRISILFFDIYKVFLLPIPLSLYLSAKLCYKINYYWKSSEIYIFGQTNQNSPWIPLSIWHERKLGRLAYLQLTTYLIAKTCCFVKSIATENHRRYTFWTNEPNFSMISF